MGHKVTLFSAAFFAWVVPALAQQPIRAVKELVLLDTVASVESIAISEDHKLMAVSSAVGGISVWNIADQSRKCDIQDRAGKTARMQFINNDTELITASFLIKEGERVAKVRKWDAKTGKVREEKMLDDAEGGFIGFSQDGRVAVTKPTQYSKIAHVWDLANNKKVQVEAEGFFWTSCYICPHNKTILTLHPGEVRLWECPSGKLRHAIPKKEATWSIEFKVSFSGDGKLFHLTFPDGCLSIWNAQTGKMATEEPLEIPGSRFAFLPDGRHVVADCTMEKGNASDLFIFNIFKRTIVAQLKGTHREMNLADLVVSKDGTVVAESTARGTISVWQLPKFTR